MLPSGSRPRSLGLPFPRLMPRRDMMMMKTVGLSMSFMRMRITSCLRTIRMVT